MNASRLVRVLIVVFAALSVAGMAFGALAENAQRTMINALDTRRELSYAVARFSETSLLMSHHVRMYVAWMYSGLDGPQVLVMYHDTVADFAGVVADLRYYAENNVSQSELDHMNTAIFYSGRLRALETEALAAMAAGELNAAFGIVFGDYDTDYRRDEARLSYALAALREATHERTQELVAAAEATVGRYQSLAALSGHALALVSFFGALFLLHMIKTANKREEEAHAMNNALIDGMPMFVEFWDEDGVLFDCSRQTIEFFGISSQEEYVRRYFEFQPEYQPCGELSRIKSERFVTSALKDGYACSEWMHIKPDTGEHILVEAIFVRAQIQDKVHIIAYNRDLREIKNAEDNLDEAEERAQMMLDAAPIAITLYDAQRKFIDCNNMALKMFGFETKEQYTESFRDMVPALQPDGRDSHAMLDEVVAEALLTGHSQNKFTLNRADGTAIAIESTYIRVRHGGEDAIIAYTTDLTESIAAREREREALEFAQTVINACPLVITMWDDTAKLVSISQQAHERYGIASQEEFIERFSEFRPEFQPCGTSSDEFLKQRHRNAFEYGYVQDEWTALSANGEPFPLFATTVLIKRNGKDMLLTYTSDLRQIRSTERKLAEAEERNQLMLNAAPIAICLYSANRAIIDCNNMSYKMFGFESKEQYFENFRDIVPALQPDGRDSHAMLDEIVGEALRTGRAYNKFWLNRADGTAIAIESTYIRARHGDEDAIIEYSYDLTEINAATAREREAYEMTQIVLDSSPFVVNVWGENENLIDVSGNFVEMLGVRDKAHYIENFFQMLPEFQPDGMPTRQRITESLREAFAEGYVHSKLEFVCLTADGEPVSTEATLVRYVRQGKRVVLSYLNDIREIKAANQKAREAYEATQDVLNASPVVVMVWDEGLNLVDVNGNFAEMFDVRDKEHFFKDFARLHPEFQPDGSRSRDKMLSSVQRAFEEGRLQRRREYVYLTASGEPLPSEITFVRYVNQGKRTVLAYMVDLRMAKTAAKREREALEYSQLLLDISPAMIEFWDGAGNLTGCNQRMLDMFDLDSVQDYISGYQHFFPKVQPCGTPSNELYESAVQTALTRGRHRYEWTYLLPDGREMPVEITNIRIEHGGKPLLVGYAHDLREIKSTMSQVKAAEERTTVLVQASPVACLLLDSNFEVIDCNHATLQLFVLQSGKDFVWHNPATRQSKRCARSCDFCPQSGQKSCLAYRVLLEHYDNIFLERSDGKRAALRQKVFEVYADEPGRSIHTFEQDFVTIHGEEISCEVTIVSVTYQDEEGVACYLRDIREEKLRAMAEEENRAKTRFLARMSHEIRTPMNAVLGITEIQLQKGGLEAEIEEAFLRIHSSSNLLLTIINDILDLSKVEAGKMEIIPETYEAASLIVDTVQLNLMHIGSKDISFKLDVCENMPTHLVGDELRLKQILNNLLSNAIKYTHEGSVSMSVSVELGDDDNAMLVVIIKDTGQGMTKEQLQKVFESEYTRYNARANRAIEGSGLGMNIAYQLITMMQGEVDVASEPGKGTTFTIRIPQKSRGLQVIGKEAAKTLANLEPTQHSLRRVTKIVREPMPYGRVLVVDDVESNLFVIRGMLMPYKITVETVMSGNEAVDKIRDGEVYDIIFMDHMMPGMDGIEATQLIRAAGYEHPVLALTANTIKGSIDLFMRNGFNGFISKPIDLHQLNSHLLRFIRDKQPPEVLEAARATTTDTEAPAPADVLPKWLVESFLRDAARAVEILGPIMREHTFDKAAIKSYTIQVHAMKSALFNVGKAELSGLAHTLDIAGRSADTQTIETLTPRFLEELREIMRELEPQPLGNMPDTDEDPAALRKQLLAIQTACEAYDVSGADKALIALREQLHSPQTTRILAELATFLLHGDIDEAAELAGRAASELASTP